MSPSQSRQQATPTVINEPWTHEPLTSALVGEEDKPYPNLWSYQYHLVTEPPEDCDQLPTSSIHCRSARVSYKRQRSSGSQAWANPVQEIPDSQRRRKLRAIQLPSAAMATNWTWSDGTIIWGKDDIFHTNLCLKWSKQLTSWPF